MKYYIIAGEASGDLHGSNLMKGLFAEDENAEIRFWGGDLMKSVGGQLVHHYKEGAIMGFAEILSNAGKLLGNISFCKKDILGWNPDVVILIDYPGFNLKIAQFCHKKGIKVFYYIAPKTWASRSGRNRKLKKWVDSMFIVFPFEKPYFDKAGISYTYKGNPLIDAVDSPCNLPDVRGKYIAILAGSRKGEISRMMPVCMELADRMHKEEKYRDYSFIVAGAPARSEADYFRFIGDREYVKLIFGNTYGILKGAEAAVINSGTASLEAALIGTPQVVCWSTSPATFFIAKNILGVGRHIKYISLGNLIIGKGAFKEFIQNDFNVDTVSEELHRLVEDKEYRSAMENDYGSIRSMLGGKGASRAIASEMITQLKA